MNKTTSPNGSFSARNAGRSERRFVIGSERACLLPGAPKVRSRKADYKSALRGGARVRVLPALLAALFSLLTLTGLFAAVPPQYIVCPPGQALVKVPDPYLLSTQAGFQLSLSPAFQRRPSRLGA